MRTGSIIIVMKMQNYFYVVISFLLISIGGYSQENEGYKEKYYTPDASKFEQFVHQAYGDRAEELVFDREIRTLILKDFLINRLTVVDRNPDIPIPTQFKQLATIGDMGYVASPSIGGPVDVSNFNPFFYKIDYLNTEKIQHIHITGTNFYLKIEPFDPEVINQLRQE